MLSPETGMEIKDIGFGTVMLRGERDKPHHHPVESEFHYFTGDDGLFISKGVKAPARRGQLFFSLPGEVHDTVNVPHKKTSLYFLRFAAGKEEADLAAKLRNVISPRGLVIGDEYRYLFEEVKQKFHSGERDLRQSALHQALAFCFEIISKKLVASHEVENRYVRKAVDFLQTAMPKAVGLADVADHVGINKHYLDRLFKKVTGVSPIQYYTRLKIETARYLLSDTGQRVNRIAEELNFCNPYYFSQTFTKHVGISPRAYRLQAR